MTNKASTPVTRSRKGSLKESVTIDDISALMDSKLRESEDRMKKYIKDEITFLTEKIGKLENSLSSVQTECARLDQEFLKIKDVLINQQLQVEKNERRLREKNLIIQNIPEENISFGSENLTDDEDKLHYIIREAMVETKPENVVSLQRLGKRQHNKIRPLRVTLSDTKAKYKFLNKRRDVLMNNNIHKTFHERIFINCDNSFLMQKEEFRLRQSLRKLKSEHPTSPVFVRSGSLYLDGSVVDSVDVRNQLF